MCRCAQPIGHWSRPAPADSCRSRARPNESSSRNSLLSGLHGIECTTLAVEHLIDLVQEIVVDHLIANIDRIGKAFGADPAMALDHEAIEPEEHAAIGLVRVHLVAQRLESTAREDIAE